MKVVMVQVLALAMVCMSANEADLFFKKNISDKPEGVVRDFYIWQFLKMPGLSAKQITEAHRLIKYKNRYINEALSSLGVEEDLPKELVCAKMSISSLLEKDVDCLVAGLKLSDVPSMPPEVVESVIDKVKDTHKSLEKVIRVMSSEDINMAMFESDASTFSSAFFAMRYNTKLKALSNVPSDKLERLADENVVQFGRVLSTIVLDPKFTNFKRALLQVDVKKAHHDTLFLLGINELRFGSKDRAIVYFNRAYEQTERPFFRDRALFWQYLVSKDESFLTRLAGSDFIDIFSIYANQKLNKKPDYIIAKGKPKLRKGKAPFDITNPYEWQEIKREILDASDPATLVNMISKFTYEETLPHLSYIMQKLTRYGINYYISPYDNMVDWDTTEQKSLVYSIARQESYFLPSVISKSFALGVMQIMPLNVKPFAKKMNIQAEYEDLFNPKIGLEMGRFYIESLKKDYKHPLFVAYSYNGGPGFLKRLLNRRELFIKGREYEPWISMELIPYEESRFYGMKVMANFIVYEEIFGNNVNIEDFLDKTLIY